MKISKKILHMINCTNGAIQKSKEFIINHSELIDNTMNFLLMILPLCIAFIAQLLFYNADHICNEYYLAKPFMGLFKTIDEGLSLDIGIILFSFSFILIINQFKNINILRKKTFSFTNTNKSKDKEPINIKNIIILSTIILISQLIIFITLTVYHNYSVIIFILWALSIVSLILIGIIIDKKQINLCLFKLTKKELFFNIAAIVFIIALGGAALDIIPPIMSYDELLISNTAYMTFKKITTINIFSNSLFCNISNLGMLFKGIFFPFLPENFIAGRYTSLGAAILTLIPFYLLTRNMFNPFIAIISTITFITNYTYLSHIRMATFPSYVIFFFITSFLFFVSALKSKNYTYIIISSILAGLATYTWGASIAIAVSIILFLIYLLITNQHKWLSILKIGALFLVTFLIIIFPLFCNSINNNNWNCFDHAVSDKTVLGGELINEYKQTYNTKSLIHIIQERTIEAIKIFTIVNPENGAPYTDFIQSIFLFISIIFFIIYRKRNIYFALMMITFLSIIFFGGILSSGFNAKRISLTIPFISILVSISIFIYTLRIKNAWRSKKLQRFTFSLIIACCIFIIMTNNLTNAFASLSRGLTPRHYSSLGTYITHLSKRNKVYLVNLSETPSKSIDKLDPDIIYIPNESIGERAKFKPESLIYSEITFNPNNNELITDEPLKNENTCFIYSFRYNHLITNYLINRFGSLEYIHPNYIWGIPYSVAIVKKKSPESGQ